MGSTGSISRIAARTMPFLAILRHDLGTLVRSWLVWLWLAATFLLSLIVVVSNWGLPSTEILIQRLLIPYLVFPWFLVVMVLGVYSVSESRAEALADGFLSRPVTRYEYLLASWAARVVLVLGVYLVVMVPAISVVTLVERPVWPVQAASGATPSFSAPATTEAEDAVTLYGVVGALGLVALVLTFQVSLAFLMGIVLRRPLLAMVVLLFLWYPVNWVLHTFQLEEFSPISLSEAVPELLRQPWPWQEKEVAAEEAAAEEDVPVSTRLFYNAFGFQPEKPERESVGKSVGKFEDFSLTRTVLGYGIPTLLAISLATVCFCLRDV
jgi:hypothetical protein